jgi:hypothetical protein
VDGTAGHVTASPMQQNAMLFNVALRRAVGQMYALTIDFNSRQRKVEKKQHQRP